LNGTPLQSNLLEILLTFIRLWSNLKLELACLLAFLPMQGFPQKQKFREEAFIKKSIAYFSCKESWPRIYVTGYQNFYGGTCRVNLLWLYKCSLPPVFKEIV
jgi:hypothetical protein